MSASRGGGGSGDALTKRREGRTSLGFWLMVFWEGGSQAHQLRRDGRLVLGRAEDCDLCVPHESVSRRHALLVGENGSWTLEDIGSSNGTFVGGVRLARGVPVAFEPGAVVSLGEARLVLDERGGLGAVAGAGRGGAGSLGEDLAEVPMQRVMRLVDMVADSLLPVLLLGETGVGKGKLAEEIHARSSRAKAPFVRLNCAAVPEPLLESELFGHERGAFTGAVQAKMGILESANHGTVFLDEIGEVPRATQAKLLHVLEHGEVLRVGSVTPRPIDVRFLAATNRDLEALVEGEHFRRDLYYRLAGVPVRIPALRERRDEIAGMTRAFLEEACERPKRPVPDVTPEALRALVEAPWTGNIRELRNVVMRAALLSGGGAVRPEHLMLDLSQPSLHTTQPREAAAMTRPPPPPLPSSPRLPEAPGVPHDAPGGRSLEHDLKDFERQRVSDALAKFDGHQGKAAEYLGVSRRTLTNKLNELALPRPRKK
jgi:DNA-binding NtrC family response regulator